MPESSGRTLRPNDLFALRYVHDARLSPDGRNVAYVISRTVEETRQELFEIVVEELASSNRRQLAFSGRATFPRWSPDGSRLAFVGSEGQSARLYVTDATMSDTASLTADGCTVQGPPAWAPDSSALAYTVVSRRKPDGIRRTTQRVFKSEGLGVVDDLAQSMHVVDVHTRIDRAIAVGRTIAVQPSFSPCGRYLLFLGSNRAVGKTIFGGLRACIVDLETAAVCEILGERWFIAAAAWSPCGRRVVVAGAHDSPLTVPTIDLWVVERDGSNARCRTKGYSGTVGLRLHHDMPTWDTSQNTFFVVADRGYAYATVTTHGGAQIWRIALVGDPSCEPVAHGARTCVVMDVNARTSQLLYGACDLHVPWELYLADHQGRQERRITKLNDAVLEGWPPMRVEHLRFTSADGVALEGWYLARAEARGPQPAVMFIHGGPMLSTGHAFRFDLHLLAANGYAVLFANFRGSEGYGASFVRAIQGDWGARAFPDHMAAVDAAIERGWADPERLGVWGPSHGGFATAWIVGHTTRFRAALVESATTNWATKYYLCDAPDWIVKELGGRPDEIPDVYRSRSPLTYAWRCRTPTLILHGEEDLRCPMAEAEQFYRALHDANCPTELVRIPEMKHMGDSVGPLSVRLAQNEVLLEWFSRHL